VGELDLLSLARAQWRANQLAVCLVTGADRAWCISADGGDERAATPPRGGILVTGYLKPARRWPDTPELKARQRRLDSLVAEGRSKGGYLLGDLTKGGRDATADDVARLGGTGPGGVPRGLERCAMCGEWHGICLDPSPAFSRKAMTVHCRCQNDSRCAACGELLYDRKLNANWYNPGDHQIWHVPGFSGLRHQCRSASAATVNPISPNAR
jgi:hypothetical protein